MALVVFRARLFSTPFTPSDAEHLSRGLPMELEGDRDIDPGLGLPTGVEGGIEMARNVSTRRAFMTFSKPIWELSGKMVDKGEKPLYETEVGTEAPER